MKEKNIFIFGHSGSQNHGNEAIVRGTHKIFNKDISIITNSIEVDKKFGLEEVGNLISIEGKLHKVNPINWIIFLLYYYNINTHFYYNKKYSKFFKSIAAGDIYLLEAGDQYCESESLRDYYNYLNTKIKSYGAKTVMYSCSIDPKLLTKKTLHNINQYDMVIARESLTYAALKNAGINNLYLKPCPTYVMPKKDMNVNSFFKNNKVIGINVGFLKQGNEKYYSLLMSNYKNLINYILENTTYSIALIPHVHWNDTASDIVSLKLLDSGDSRIKLFEINRADVQRHIMSQCKIMVSLRTHASIPAVAEGVPTIFTGYKHKTTGIFHDIFNDKFPYLLVSVGNLKSDNDLLFSFKQLEKDYSEVKSFLDLQIPLIKKEVLSIKDLINNI